MSKNNPRDNLLELTILKIIQAHVGQEHAIRRDELLETLTRRGYDLDDRKMRKAIENLRFHVSGGAWICSTKNGSGYFFAESEDEMVEYLKSESSRGW
jgi:DNA-binding response OmpR family regulator